MRGKVLWRFLVVVNGLLIPVTDARVQFARLL
jgi:hypothetical protein